MDIRSVIRSSKACVVALCLGLFLTGCGGGSGDSGQASQQSSGNGQDAVNRSAALSWNAPDTRENGDLLRMADLTGYVISYGQDPENLTETIRIGDSDTMQFTVTDLADGTWFFTVQVEDGNGLVSAPSPQVSKTI